MKKLIFSFSIICTSLFCSCVDKNELVDEDSMPDWLGESIYGELQRPEIHGQLQGTFNTYLKLIDDLGYSEVLNRTGSKTVFPANDDAFDRFFKSGQWSGVSCYEDLTVSQKKLLLYSSMLDNALLTNMLSNVSSGNEIKPGMAIKHATSLSVIDTITYYPLATAVEDYPNNENWINFNKGVAVVKDATTPMMVHFTPEYMLTNGITTGGIGSDFGILMGGDYTEGDSYIYRNRIVTPNVTCQNGYIHQVDDVIVPPGNMAELLKNTDNLSIISHMFDRFAVPVYNAEVTNSYHDWFTAMQNGGNDMEGIVNPDSLYEVRYESELSQGTNKFDNQGKATNLLTLDIGWNGYYSGSTDATLTDLAVLFVPNDETIKEYFVNGAGKAIMDRYATKENTKENVMSNIDDIPQNVVQKLLSNMMQLSFKDNVPSKFSRITDYESGEFMGISSNQMAKKENGEYDVHIANNGVVYVMDRVLSPNSYDAVSAPTLFNSNTNMINWIIENKSTDQYPLFLDFYAYLLAMQANFALFLPTDQAFSAFYVDPAALGHQNPTAVKYTWKGGASGTKFIASKWSYDPTTNTVRDSLEEISFANMSIIRNQLVDIMNYCTVVLKNGEKLGNNKFYKTKHGGAIKITGDVAKDYEGGTVSGGSQIDGLLHPATITKSYAQANGHSYMIDKLIQGPHQSVYSVLNDNTKNPQFSKFAEICQTLSNEELLKWAFDYSTPTDEQQREMNMYSIFTNRTELPNCLDYNVRFFNMYNYTVYIPNNQAVEIAQEHGLPLVSELQQVWQNDVQYDLNDPSAKIIVKDMLRALRSFVLYHFHNTSVFADNVIEPMDYSTFLIDEKQINMKLSVSGGNGKLNIKDASGSIVTVEENSDATVNVMTRDFEFDADREIASYVKASSFAVIHEISSPLFYNTNKDFSKGIAAAKNHQWRY